jgi:methyl-accepting chemotaxis protein
VRELNAQESALRAKSDDLQSSMSPWSSAAAAGDFTRASSKDYGNADLNRFAASVNQLVDGVDGGVNETRRVIASLSNGDLTQTMRGNFQGAFAELQQNVNDTLVDAAEYDARSSHHDGLDQRQLVELRSASRRPVQAHRTAGRSA